MTQARWARGRTWLPMAVVMSILFAACGGTTTSQAPTSSAAAPTAAASTSAAPSADASTPPAADLDPIVPGDPRLTDGAAGGTFTGAFVGPCCVGVDNMNPMSAGGDYEFLHFIWEHLVTYSVVPSTVATNPYSGHYGPLVPELADSWEVSADQLTWTFKLHPGVKWSDGTDFTSADVKFSFELCLNSKVGPVLPRRQHGQHQGRRGRHRRHDEGSHRRPGTGSADRHDRDRRAERAASLQRHGPVHPPEGLGRAHPARTMEKNADFRTPGRPSAPARSRSRPTPPASRWNSAQRRLLAWRRRSSTTSSVASSRTPRPR